MLQTSLFRISVRILWASFIFVCHRKKKRRLVVPDGVENDVHTEHIESRKSLRKKEKVYDYQRKPCMNSTSEGAKKSNDIDETMPSVKR